MKEIVVRKGERTRVLHLLFDSIPQQVKFTAAPASGEGPVRGSVEVVGSNWIFKKPPLHHELAPEQRFDKGFWDSIYSIYVTADEDVTIRFETRHFSSRLLLWTLGTVIAVAVASVLVMSVLRGM
jgi:hypothetical protein